MPLTKHILAMLGLLAAFAASAHAGDLHYGDGTAYSGPYDKDDTGKNSCQFGRLEDRWEKYYAALPSQVFDRDSDCGKCIKARGTEDDATGKWVTVMVVDECASCDGNGDIDFSSTALKDITGYSWDRKRIEWEWTSCDSEDASDGSSSSEEAGEDDSRRRLSFRRMLRL